jgi:hypothetical protein
MVLAAHTPDAQFGPWNPGIESQIPDDLRALATIFRPEHVFTSLARADEMRDLTGLPIAELVAFRPERLALHELLVRVTADVSVPDGSKIEDLGINFRKIVSVILARYVAPQMGAITAAYDAMRRQVSTLIDAELAPLFPAAARSETRIDPAPKPGFLARLKRRRAAETVADPATNGERRLIAEWEAKAAAADEGQRAAYLALARVVSALLVRHGRVWGSRELVASLATEIACNRAGGDAIGTIVEACVAEAAANEGYTLLPRQEHPVVMNTKGASAAGKSTLRPLQKKLAGDIGVDWGEFALISPDIWRKQLLDYGALGPAYKYAGAFTGDELQIVDEKLDRYMARKAAGGDMTHLLIDRFRFDSFAPHSDEAGSNLLTRFGDSVYLFFVITPPASLVERAWNRGLEVGRYKAVDDTLAHSVEAYSGMPELFFTWVARKDKQVQFEFLDNSVVQGERPRTVAFGSNDILNVLDVPCMLDVERNRRVNVDARAPELLFADRNLLAAERNTGFLRQCADRFREVNFADQATGRICLHLTSGVADWADPEALERASADPDTRAGLLAVAPALADHSLAGPGRPRDLADAAATAALHTLGRWGPSVSDC